MGQQDSTVKITGMECNTHVRHLCVAACRAAQTVQKVWLLTGRCVNECNAVVSVSSALLVSVQD